MVSTRNTLRGPLYCAPRSEPMFSCAAKDLPSLLEDIRSPLVLVLDPSTRRVGIVRDGDLQIEPRASDALPVRGILPPLYPESLGDPGFLETHGLRGSSPDRVGKVNKIVKGPHDWIVRHSSW